jgi:DNA-binding response OmpR family regulator
MTNAANDHRILVVDDEPSIVDAVATALRYEGYEVEEASNGRQALTAATTFDPHLIVLDWMLPDVEGIEVGRRLRERGFKTAILFLTAKDATENKVEALRAGGDDYVTKPFSLAELISRVRAILRRRRLDSAPPVTSIRKVGALELDLIRHRARIEGKPLPLTPSEFRLLALLAEDPERAVSRREIMQHLWESSFVGDQRACDTHILNIRRKLERDPAHPTRLVTVRGLGYQLVAD